MYLTPAVSHLFYHFSHQIDKLASMGHQNSDRQKAQGLGGYHPYVEIISFTPMIVLIDIAVTVVSPHMGSDGWPFASVDPYPGADSDPLYNSQHVKDLYFKANPEYGGRSELP